MYKEIFIETQVFDLDYNRHVTSRTYENFAYAGRMDLLDSIGLSIHELLKLKYKVIANETTVRFLNQQFAGSKLKVRTSAYQDSSGLIHWNHLIEDKDGKAVCDLKSNSYLMDNKNQPLQVKSLRIDPNNLIDESAGKKIEIDPSQLEYHTLNIQMNTRPEQLTPLTHSIKVPFNDLNIFWTLSSVAVWKFFEEGRFLFFKEVFGIGADMEIDVTTFFMNANIQIFELPEPGTIITMESWIDSIEKIRFYFRQDIRDANGKLLASMRDEQLFVKLSASKPCRVPQEFYDKTKKYRLE
ncbi:acyl-CoA thioesterase [Leptospira sp. GIMC2001]|uniref:acyl-CoA thioesterase n=1 Tax=Leptospira sp. GIMC2001 TaxID=1513297 RepID=UPI0023490138|nr:acyl-CoA thioesterase [Leptospira sp. GIMC2001]WCL47597.1 acyl-CoA thioesterase [Leptospira sp. GIMC2001]